MKAELLMLEAVQVTLQIHITVDDMVIFEHLK